MTSLVVLSLPTSAAPGTMGEPETRVKNWIDKEVGSKYGVSSVVLPDLKIGTLDSLVQQSEVVSGLDNQLQQMVNKTHDAISQFYEGDEAKTSRAELINGRPAWQYLQQFGWNTAKYRPDRPIPKILAAISEEANSADADLKVKTNMLSQAKAGVANLDRRATGDLTVRSLDSVVKKSDVVLDSEYLQSVLVVVPNSQVRDFTEIYETLVPMVVPRSAHKITGDSEFTLFSITVFRKHASDFENKARERKWFPRDLSLGDKTRDPDALKKEDELRSSERELRVTVEKLAAATFSDLVKAWGHIKIIRLFVESVLRYGLPPSYITAAFVPKGSVAKAELTLISQFGFLGGNAVAKDKRGRIVGDGDLGEYSALVEHDYRPFAVFVSLLPGGE